jgi:monoamine oxidase
MMEQRSVIIIGAGAAGLMAAKELSAKGFNTTILEAGEKAGGRMCTETKSFGFAIEPAAEFIHGNLELTLGLLKEANIEATPINGEMVHIGDTIQDTAEENYWPLMMQHMEELQEDITLQQFLNTYFSGDEYKIFRKQIEGFAQGFDLADPAKAATIPLKEEWQHEQEQQYRIAGGYISLTNFLLQCCKENNASIYYNSNVHHIEWQPNHATVSCTNRKKFIADKIIITVPLGVLQQQNISFTPAIPEQQNAWMNIGFGNVIKVLVHFKTGFWQAYGYAGFIISNEVIPTWWLQTPDNNVLTGWLGGPSSSQFNNYTTGQMLELTLQSLSNIFKTPVDFIKQQLQHFAVYNWENQPYTLGGYSYNTLSSIHAKQTLTNPIAHTIYFAGEALYTGDAQSTVEAALQTGLAAAQKIIQERL